MIPDSPESEEEEINWSEMKRKPLENGMRTCNFEQIMELKGYLQAARSFLFNSRRKSNSLNMSPYKAQLVATAGLHVANPLSETIRATCAQILSFFFTPEHTALLLMIWVQRNPRQYDFPVDLALVPTLIHMLSLFDTSESIPLDSDSFSSLCASLSLPLLSFSSSLIIRIKSLSDIELSKTISVTTQTTSGIESLASCSMPMAECPASTPFAGRTSKPTALSIPSNFSAFPECIYSILLQVLLPEKNGTENNPGCERQRKVWEKLQQNLLSEIGRKVMSSPLGQIKNDLYKCLEWLCQVTPKTHQVTTPRVVCVIVDFVKRGKEGLAPYVDQISSSLLRWAEKGNEDRYVALYGLGLWFGKIVDFGFPCSDFHSLVATCISTCLNLLEGKEDGCPSEYEKARVILPLERAVLYFSASNAQLCHSLLLPIFSQLPLIVAHDDVVAFSANCYAVDIAVKIAAEDQQLVQTDGMPLSSQIYQAIIAFRNVVLFSPQYRLVSSTAIQLLQSLTFQCE